MTNRKNIDTDTEDGLKNVEVNERFLQIRRQMFGDSNAEFSKKIGENDKIVSAICNKSRSAGQTTILKLLQSMPDIDANWLMTGVGQMQRPISQTAGNISHSTAVGVNVNGNDINISYDPLLLPTVESLSNSVSRLTAQNAQLLGELSRLIDIIQKKLC